MHKNVICAIWILVFISGFARVTLAEMTSTNYRIPTAVMSGGGGYMESSGYEANSTIGQQSPLADPADPPYSDSYDLYPGFWYTVANVGLTCPGDGDGDKDVDGSDLADYSDDSGGLSIDVFAANFGKINCP